MLPVSVSRPACDLAGVTTGIVHNAEDAEPIAAALALPLDKKAGERNRDVFGFDVAFW